MDTIENIDDNNKKKKNNLLIKVLLATVVIAIPTTYFFTIGNSNKILLTNKDNKLEWSVKSKNLNLKDMKFQIESNGKIIGDTKELSYLDNNAKDEEKPNQIKQLLIDYTKDNINIKWDKPEDNGTKYTYKVYLVNSNGKKVYSSNKIEYIDKSDIKNYILEVNNQKYTIDKDKNTYNLKTDFKEGIYPLEIYSIDNSNNISSHFNSSIYNYKLNTDKDTVKNNDTSQNYKYNVYVDDKKTDYTSLKDVSNLKDTIAPSEVKNAFIDYRKLDIEFDKATDNPKNYSYYLVGEGEKGNKAFSQTFNLTKLSGLKGYYYKIDTNSEYTVSEKDNFSNTNILDINNLNLNEGDYFIHILSSDNDGNLSKTNNIKITIPSKVKIGYLNKMFIFDNGLTEGTFNEMYDKASKIDEKILNTLSKRGTKVYVIKDSVTPRVHKDLDYDLPTSDIVGVFLPINDRVYVNKSNQENAVIHELGHAYDYNYSANKYKTEDNSFYYLFMKEKDKLFDSSFSGQYAKSTQQEYYAECFRLYFTDRENLKTKAPLSFQYVQKDVTN